VPADFLALPEVPEKPRPCAVTHMLDKGLPLQLTADHLNSYAQHMDFWKFGWGTAYLETALTQKITLLRDHGVVSCLGGTLLEIAWAQDAVEDCLSWAREVGFTAIEVSRGSVPMSRLAKGELIARATQHFTVLAETGYKDADRFMGIDDGLRRSPRISHMAPPSSWPRAARAARSASTTTMANPNSMSSTL